MRRAEGLGANISVVLALRELPLLRQRALSAPTYALAMFPALRFKKTGRFTGSAQSGVLVMRPGQLVFLELL